MMRELHTPTFSYPLISAFYCDGSNCNIPVSGKLGGYVSAGGYESAFRVWTGIFYNSTPVHPHTTNIVYPGETHAGISALIISNYLNLHKI